MMGPEAAKKWSDWISGKSHGKKDHKQDKQDHKQDKHQDPGQGPSSSRGSPASSGILDLQGAPQQQEFVGKETFEAFSNQMQAMFLMMQQSVAELAANQSTKGNAERSAKRKAEDSEEEE